MENIYPALVIGIASSLVATAIFIAISMLFSKVILPWYTDKIYRGVRIDGEWEIKEIDGQDLGSLTPDMYLSLKQRGEKITGKYSHKLEDEFYEYTLEGKIKNMYFLATAVPKSNRSIDGVCFLFHIDYSNSKLIMTGGILSKSVSKRVSCFDGIKFSWINS